MKPIVIPTPGKILVRGVNWLGDAVMSTPALRRLREARPHDSITLLTDAKLADLWKGNPNVDRVISFSKEDTTLRLASRLRSEAFDAALVFPNSFRSALEALLARIPVRIGYSTNGRRLLLSHALAARPGAQPMHKRSVSEIRKLVKVPAVQPATRPALKGNTGPLPQGESHGNLPGVHSVHHLHNYLHLVQVLGASAEPMAPQIPVPEGEIVEFVRKFGLESHQHARTPIFGLNPGAEYGPAKRWPEKGFIAAAVEVQRLTGCCWLIFGAAKDQSLTAVIMTDIVSGTASRAKNPGLPVVFDLAGKTTLRELCAGLSLCSVVLTNDSGPMHLAAAVGTRVVVPFGSTSPELTAPGLPGMLSCDQTRLVLPASAAYAQLIYAV